jgi:hypothetical protein
MPTREIDDERGACLKLFGEGETLVMTLFTKPGCEKCLYITDKFDLDKLGIKQEVLGQENADALAHLAWHELVDVAERELPILVLDDMSHLSGAIKIKLFLSQIEGRA